MGVEMNCPFDKCKGKLKLTMASSTCMGWFGLDRNNKVEVFMCDTCAKQVKRHWKWQEVKNEES
jgi:hypothetical protein